MNYSKLHSTGRATNSHIVHDITRSFYMYGMTMIDYNGHNHLQESNFCFQRALSSHGPSGSVAISFSIPLLGDALLQKRGEWKADSKVV